MFVSRGPFVLCVFDSFGPLFSFLLRGWGRGGYWRVCSRVQSLPWRNEESGEDFVDSPFVFLFLIEAPGSFIPSSLFLHGSAAHFFERLLFYGASQFFRDVQVLVRIIASELDVFVDIRPTSLRFFSVSCVIWIFTQIDLPSAVPSLVGL